VRCDDARPGRISLCQKLKSDGRTDHIPVILLTARADAQSKRSGLETGADDYLTKPFGLEELLLRVGNLIESRRQLKERFSRQITLQPAGVSVISPNEQFIQKALAVVEANLSDADFDVEAFSREMGVGRTQLHNKLTALAGQSAGELLRTMRLKRAACLLPQNPGNVSEVAYLAGFSSPGYFAKCFRDFYGQSPTEYARMHLPADRPAPEGRTSKKA
jgi:AraC-like DNA-binding protein